MIVGAGGMGIRVRVTTWFYGDDVHDGLGDACHGLVSLVIALTRYCEFMISNSQWLYSSVLDKYLT